MSNKRLGAGNWIAIRASALNLPDPTSLRGKTVTLTLDGATVRRVFITSEGDQADHTEIRMQADVATVAVVEAVPE